ncbi:arsenate-mycothiol transferase ArsC [Gaopeijia maritima]|uniref:arsenate-mycothiol transferase ArsC n=2 Tax=Gaopeijia maritima TaxID=3119007 RepID=UPI0032960AD5
MVQRLRSFARRMINRVEALLHPGRRRAALARAQARSDRSVVFICYGNICRSPFAELWMRRHDPDGAARYLSAGFRPGGRSSPDTAIAVSADRFDLDLRPHVSRGLDEVPEGDHLWVVMERVHRQGLMAEGVPADDIVYLGDLDPGPVERRAIIDPYGRDPEVFEAIYDRIVRCLRELPGDASA